MKYRLFLGALLISCTGCTVIHVEGAQRVELVSLGTVRIVPADGAKVVSFRSRGIGMVPLLTGASFGVARQDAVIQYSSACNVVIFELPKDEAQRKLWIDLLGRNHSVCSTAGGGNE